MMENYSNILVLESDLVDVTAKRVDLQEDSTVLSEYAEAGIGV